MQNFKNLIGGEWVEAGDGATFLNENPANHEDVTYAFASPRKRTPAPPSRLHAPLPAWANMPPPSRALHPRQGQPHFEARQHEYAAILTREEGKTRSEAWAK